VKYANKTRQVDTGLEVMPGTDGETSTQGLDGLGVRCAKYYKQVGGDSSPLRCSRFFSCFVAPIVLQAGGL
jgi:hypothetical protein